MFVQILLSTYSVCVKLHKILVEHMKSIKFDTKLTQIFQPYLCVCMFFVWNGTRAIARKISMGLIMRNFSRLIRRNGWHFARAFESSFLTWDIEPLFAIRGRWEESCRKVRSSWLLSLPQRPQWTRRRSDRHFLCGEGTSKHLFEPRVSSSLSLSLFLSLSLLPVHFFLSFRTRESRTRLHRRGKTRQRNPRWIYFPDIERKRHTSLDLRGFNI